MAFCSKCGTQLNESAKFCPNCGHSIKNVVDNTKKNNSIAKWAIICFVLVALVIGGWFMWNNQKNDYSLEGLAKVVTNYDAIENFYDGMAMVTKGDKYGFIDKMGNEVIPCIYEYSGMEANFNFSDGLALVYKDNGLYFINKKGEKAFSFNYDWSEGFSEGFALVCKNEKYGFIDTSGKEIVPLIYDYANHFSDGMAAVIKGDKYGYIDKTGKLVIPIAFEGLDEMNEAYSFREGLAQIEKNGKLGFIDTSGKEVIPCKYDIAYGFSEGLAVIMKGEKYGFIDTKGNEIIACEFDSADSFTNGNAVVKKNGKYSVIDKSGKVLFSSSDEIRGFKDGLAMVSSSSGDKTLHGFIDTNGKEIIPPIYDTWYDFSEGLVAVSKDGINGYIDKNGKSTFDYLSADNIAKIKEKQENDRNKEEKYNEENYRVGIEYEEESDDKQVDISPILYECQNEITAIQREIEDACRTFVVLGSQDVDMYKYTQMKSTFLNGVSDLQRKADKAFDKCARELQEAGFSDAVAKVNEEKRQFHSAIYELTTRATQQTDMSY